MVKKYTVVSSATLPKRQQPRGKVVQSILDMFEANPDYAYTTADIAMAAYDVDLAGVTRPHRVAVQRAMKRYIEIDTRLAIQDGGGKTGQLVIFDQTSVQSRGVAKYKSSQWVSDYQRFGREYIWINGRKCNPDNHIKKWLKEDKQRQAMEPGGYWHTLTRIATLRLEGDTELADQLEAEDKAARDARLDAMFGKRPEPTREQQLTKIGNILLQLEVTDEEMELIVRSVKQHRDGVASTGIGGKTQQNDMECPVSNARYVEALASLYGNAKPNVCQHPACKTIILKGRTHCSKHNGINNGNRWPKTANK